MTDATASRSAPAATSTDERSAGWVAGFHRPPPVATEASTPRGVSAVAANAPTPAGADDTPDTSAGSAHTSETATVAPAA